MPSALSRVAGRHLGGILVAAALLAVVAVGGLSASTGENDPNLAELSSPSESAGRAVGSAGSVSGSASSVSPKGCRESCFVFAAALSDATRARIGLDAFAALPLADRLLAVLSPLSERFLFRRLLSALFFALVPRGGWGVQQLIGGSVDDEPSTATPPPPLRESSPYVAYYHWYQGWDPADGSALSVHAELCEAAASLPPSVAAAMGGLPLLQPTAGGSGCVLVLRGPADATVAAALVKADALVATSHTAAQLLMGPSALASVVRGVLAAQRLGPAPPAAFVAALCGPAGETSMQADPSQDPLAHSYLCTPNEAVTMEGKVDADHLPHRPTLKPPSHGSEHRRSPTTDWLLVDDVRTAARAHLGTFFEAYVADGLALLTTLG